MKVISIINLKGGVGKTFTSYNTAYELGKHGYKVLVLDNDKQGNVSKALGCYRADNECAVSKILTRNYECPNELMQHTELPNVDIIPSNMSLMAAVWRLSTESNNQIDRYNVIVELASKYYDYIIIDNPPDIALNVINALAITDEVIVPVKIDEWSLEGLDIITNQIIEARVINPKIKMLGVLVTMYKNDDTNIAGIEWLEKKSKVNVLAKIRYTPKAVESTFFGKPIYEYSSRSSAAQDYKKFVNQYIESEGK